MASKKVSKPVNKPTASSPYLFLKYPYLFLALLVAIVYTRTLWADLTHFDDAIFVVDMKEYMNDWGNVIESFKRGVFDSGMYYRPVLLIDFIIEHHLFGENPAGYHFTNVLFHLIAVLLFFQLLVKMKTGELSAFFMAALFAVHPVLSHGVIWIPGRNDILLSIFLLASLIQLINWLQEGKPKHLVWFLVWVLFALFTKETSWLIPVLFIAYTMLLTDVKPTDRKIIFPVVGVALSFIIYFLLKSQVKTQESLIRPDVIDMVVSRLPILHQYIGKIFFPFNLSVVPLIEDTSNIPGLIAVVVLAAIIILTKSYKKPKAIFGLIWFALFLFPLLLVLPPITNTVISFENPAYEHRLYLSLLGMFIFLGTAIEWEAATWKKEKLYVTAFVLILFSALSFSRIHHFDNALSFFEKAVKDAPHSATSKVAFGSRIYRDTTQRQRAVELFNQSYQLNPNERYVNFFLGLEYIETNNPQKAEEHLRREVNNTDFYEANFSLADLLFKKGEYDSSIYYLQKLVAGNKTDARVFNNLIILYIEKHDYQAANSIIQIGQQNGIALKPDMVYEVQRHMMPQ